MLFAGSDDGVYRVDGVHDGPGTTAERVLETDRVYRVGRLDGLGLFAAGEAGLYRSPDGESWTRLPVPEEQVYAVAASAAGDRLYAGTRPSRVFVADPGAAGEPGAWSELEGFRELRERADWGIPRHDGVSQVRSLVTHPDAPDRVVAGVEVGGVQVSDDGGDTWTARHVEGEAPHTDDIHHLARGGPDTLLAATGSGLFRTDDAGRSWTRLDTGHRQRYFRESLLHEGVVYAGAAPASSTSWEEDTDHALFEGRDGALERVDSPTPEEVPLGWCVTDRAVVTACHRGSLLANGGDGFQRVGSVPVPGAVRGRYLPLWWDG